MEIWNSLRRKWTEEVVIKSIIWNTIIDIFKKEKNVDLSDFLVSIKLKWNSVLIKTSKPIVNLELYNFKEDIEKISSEKIKKVWLKFKDFELKFF